MNSITEPSKVVKKKYQFDIMIHKVEIVVPSPIYVYI